MIHSNKPKLNCNPVILVSVVSALAACGSPKVVSDRPGQSDDAIAMGAVTLGNPANFSGSMQEMDNLPNDASYGVDFVYSLKLDQAAHLVVEDSHNYDCDFGAYLRGPSYYFYLEDGSTRIYDYELRSTYSNIPGRSLPNFPDLLPAGAHQLVVRFYADEVCNMAGTIKLSDRYAPASTPSYITDYALTGDWSMGETEVLTINSFGSFKWQQGETIIEGKAFNHAFDEPRKLILTFDSVTAGTETTPAVGARLYCAYEISGYSGRTLKLACSSPNTTTFTTDFSTGKEFSRKEK